MPLINRRQLAGVGLDLANIDGMNLNKDTKTLSFKSRLASIVVLVSLAVTPKLIAVPQAASSKSDSLQAEHPQEKKDKQQDGTSQENKIGLQTIKNHARLEHCRFCAVRAMEISFARLFTAEEYNDLPAVHLLAAFLPALMKSLSRVTGHLCSTVPFNSNSTLTECSTLSSQLLGFFNPHSMNGTLNFALPVQ